MTDTKRRPIQVLKGPVGTALFWVVLVAAMLAGTQFYAPGTEPESSAAVNENIIADAAAYAQENYESVVVPSIEENAVDVVTLANLLSEDVDAAGAEYGHRNGDSPYSFPVTLIGMVAEGSFGQIGVNVDGMPEGMTVGVQTGPAITGTAIRDSVGTITFEMFRNQIDFAAVATALNEQVKVSVLNDTDFESLIGQEITVVGAFTYTDVSHILVTPVSLVVSSD